MINLILIELHKIFRKLRTYIGFAALAVLIPVIQIALYFEGDGYINFATRNIKQSFVIVGNLMNGYLIANMVLQLLFIHIPFLIVLVGGDLLAGEATSGTYRMLISRPISRFKLVTSKFLSGLIYTNLLLVWMLILSLGVSILIFGTGELIVLKEKIYIFAKDDVLWRFFLAYGFAALSMSTVLALSFLFSSFVENAIGPIVATMAVIIIFLILSALPVDFLQAIKPYLFVNHMVVWREFMGDPIDYSKIINSGLVLGGHIIGFYLITLYTFIKKDILS
ncbi:MAG: ABC transporter permease subunit [Ignavibacteria bacterium]|jgi:ABC-2 type transport system permease protein